MSPRCHPGLRCLLLGLVLLFSGCGPKKKAVPKEIRDELAGLTPAGRTTVSPGGMVHVVKRGDTLNAICRQYNCRRGDLMAANDIYDPNRISVGQRLVIPGRGAPAPTAAPRQRYASEPDMSGVVSESSFVWPHRGRILQPYDEDGHGIEHRWITVEGRTGDKVVASKSGVVSFVSECFQGLGKVVIIQHGDGFSTMYGYLSKVSVKPQEQVRQGQVIAEVGQTGRADSPQLWFKIIRGKHPVNPIRYLP